MKVCILSCFDDLMSKDTGGSVRIYSLAKNLSNLGNEVHIVVPGTMTSSQKMDGLTLHRIKGLLPLTFLNAIASLFGILRPTFFYFYDFVFIAKLNKLIRDENFDIIQIEQPWAGGFLIPLTTKTVNKPLVVDSHDVFQTLRTEQRTLLTKLVEVFFEKRAYDFADLILVVSKREKQILCKYGVPENKVMVIPNGVDTSTFLPVSILSSSRELNNLPEQRKVVFVGNMEYPPNQEAVREIALNIEPKVRSKISNVCFLVVGRTPKNFNESFSNLVFTGVVKDVTKLLIDSNVAIAPLLHGSGTKLKILEYLACGLPVVSTSVGVEGLVVQDGENVLIENDMNEFAVAITKLLEDKELALTLGQAGAQLVNREYDWQKIVKRLNRAYFSLLIQKTRCTSETSVGSVS
jgi:glycosyltransferase involved in cell wall biosynthesis